MALVRFREVFEATPLELVKKLRLWESSSGEEWNLSSVMVPGEAWTDRWIISIPI